MNSYRANGGGNHMILGAGIDRKNLAERIVFSSQKSMRELLMNYIESESIISPVRNHNWCMVPEDWVEKAEVKARQLLWPE